MIQILTILALTLINVVLVLLIKAIINIDTRPVEKKQLKTQIRASKKRENMPKTEEERIYEIELENIENYGTSKPQRDLK